MLRFEPAVGVRHGEYPEYLRIYRPGPLFLENSHALSSLDRQPYATGITLCRARLKRGYKRCKSGSRHRAGLPIGPDRKSGVQCDLTHRFAMPIWLDIGYIFPNT